jgi:hypothetical protein
MWFLAGGRPCVELGSICVTERLRSCIDCGPSSDARHLCGSIFWVAPYHEIHILGGSFACEGIKVTQSGVDWVKV